MKKWISRKLVAQVKMKSHKLKKGWWSMRMEKYLSYCWLRSLKSRHQPRSESLSALLVLLKLSFSLQPRLPYVLIWPKWFAWENASTYITCFSSIHDTRHSNEDIKKSQECRVWCHQKSASNKDRPAKITVSCFVYK